MATLLWCLAAFAALAHLTSAFECPEQKTQSLIPDPEDCRKYYHCLPDNRVFPMQCPKGLVFDPQQKVCSWDSNARSCAPDTVLEPIKQWQPEEAGNTAPTSAPKENKLTTTNSNNNRNNNNNNNNRNNNSRQKVDTTPRSHNQRANNQPEPQKQTPTTTHKPVPQKPATPRPHRSTWSRNQSSKKATAPATTTTPRPTTTTPPPPPPTTTAPRMDKENSGDYFGDILATLGFEVPARDKPEDLGIPVNPDILHRSEPENPLHPTEREPKVQNNNNYDDNNYNRGHNDRQASLWQHTRRRRSPENNMVQDDVRCPSGYAYFPDPSSCSAFYHCYNWQPMRKLCPPGLFFDDQTYVCNWPHNVNCIEGYRAKTLYSFNEMLKETRQTNKANHKSLVVPRTFPTPTAKVTTPRSPMTKPPTTTKTTTTTTTTTTTRPSTTRTPTTQSTTTPEPTTMEMMTSSTDLPTTYYEDYSETSDNTFSSTFIPFDESSSTQDVVFNKWRTTDYDMTTQSALYDADYSDFGTTDDGVFSVRDTKPTPSLEPVWTRGQLTQSPYKKPQFDHKAYSLNPLQTSAKDGETEEKEESHKFDEVNFSTTAQPGQNLDSAYNNKNTKSDDTKEEHSSREWQISQDRRKDQNAGYSWGSFKDYAHKRPDQIRNPFALVKEDKPQDDIFVEPVHTKSDKKEIRTSYEAPKDRSGSMRSPFSAPRQDVTGNSQLESFNSPKHDPVNTRQQYPINSRQHYPINTRKQELDSGNDQKQDPINSRLRYNFNTGKQDSIRTSHQDPVNIHAKNADFLSTVSSFTWMVTSSLPGGLPEDRIKPELYASNDVKKLSVKKENEADEQSTPVSATNKMSTMRAAVGDAEHLSETTLSVHSSDSTSETSSPTSVLPTGVYTSTVSAEQGNETTDDNVFSMTTIAPNSSEVIGQGENVTTSAPVSSNITVPDAVLYMFNDTQENMSNQTNTTSLDYTYTDLTLLNSTDDTTNISSDSSVTTTATIRTSSAVNASTAISNTTTEEMTTSSQTTTIQAIDFATSKLPLNGMKSRLVMDPLSWQNSGRSQAASSSYARGTQLRARPHDTEGRSISNPYFRAPVGSSLYQEPSAYSDFKNPEDVQIEKFMINLLNDAMRSRHVVSRDTGDGAMKPDSTETGNDIIKNNDVITQSHESERIQKEEEKPTVPSLYIEVNPNEIDFSTTANVEDMRVSGKAVPEMLAAMSTPSDAIIESENIFQTEGLLAAKPGRDFSAASPRQKDDSENLIIVNAKDADGDDFVDMKEKKTPSDKVIFMSDKGEQEELDFSGDVEDFDNIPPIQAFSALVGKTDAKTVETDGKIKDSAAKDTNKSEETILEQKTSKVEAKLENQTAAVKDSTSASPVQTMITSNKSEATTPATTSDDLSTSVNVSSCNSTTCSANHTHNSIVQPTTTPASSTKDALPTEDDTILQTNNTATDETRTESSLTSGNATTVKHETYIAKDALNKKETPGDDNNKIDDDEKVTKSPDDADAQLTLTDDNISNVIDSVKPKKADDTVEADEADDNQEHKTAATPDMSASSSSLNSTDKTESSKSQSTTVASTHKVGNESNVSQNKINTNASSPTTPTTLKNKSSVSSVTETTKSATMTQNSTKPAVTTSADIKVTITTNLATTVTADQSTTKLISDLSAASSAHRTSAANETSAVSVTEIDITNTTAKNTDSSSNTSSATSSSSTLVVSVDDEKNGEDDDKKRKDSDDSNGKNKELSVTENMNTNATVTTMSPSNHDGQDNNILSVTDSTASDDDAGDSKTTQTADNTTESGPSSPSDELVPVAYLSEDTKSLTSVNNTAANNGNKINTTTSTPEGSPTAHVAASNTSSSVTTSSSTEMSTHTSTSLNTNTSTSTKSSLDLNMSSSTTAVSTNTTKTNATQTSPSDKTSIDSIASNVTTVTKMSSVHTSATVPSNQSSTTAPPSGDSLSKYKSDNFSSNTPSADKDHSEFNSEAAQAADTSAAKSINSASEDGNSLLHVSTQNDEPTNTSSNGINVAADSEKEVSEGNNSTEAHMTSSGKTDAAIKDKTESTTTVMSSSSSISTEHVNMFSSEGALKNDTTAEDSNVTEETKASHNMGGITSETVTEQDVMDSETAGTKRSFVSLTDLITWYLKHWRNYSKWRQGQTTVSTTDV